MLGRPARFLGPSALPLWAGALVLVSALVIAACSKVESCRSGTLFLNVNLGRYTSADELDVDVSVTGAIDGNSPRHTVLTLKAGATSGGVEVEFPSGYPTGETVTVTLTLLSGGTQLAERALTISSLPPGCTTASVDFTATDGGTDGSAGRGGDTGGSGGRAGTGGTGTGGTGGTGTGGTGGSGTGAGGASGGTGGACVPTGPEDCFNNQDDDCNGKIDCADPACNPKAQCVTADPSAAPIGVLTGTGGCLTDGYGTATKIMDGPNPLSCTAGGGCSCTPPAVTCSTSLTSYNTAGLCEAGSTVSEKAGTFTTGDDKNCATIPAWSTNPSGDIFGISASKFTATASAGCTASGSPVVPTLTWTSSGTFCATSTIGGGCAAGQVCVPALGAASACQLFDGAKSSCPGGAAPLPWYTGTTGTASCGACSCGSATGANRDNVALTIGSEYTCSGAGSVSSGGTTCFASGIYEPGVQFSGTPTAPSCTPQSAYTGNLTASGPKTLCCP
jgi:hypothetical protein